MTPSDVGPVLIRAQPEPLDAQLLAVLTSCSHVLDQSLSELVALPKQPTPASQTLHVWAITYCATLRDVSSSLAALLETGRNNRSALILRRVIFEYFIRFRFFQNNADQARIALEDGTPEMKKFARRLWDDEALTIHEDPTFDLKKHRSTDKLHKHFYRVVGQVLSLDDTERAYARFFMHPSWLAHGSAASTIDVLAVNRGKREVHVLSTRRTQEIGYNSAAFLISFLEDVCSAFQLETASLVSGLRAEQAAAATALQIEPIGPSRTSRQ